jgi:hypothetical protein
MLSAAFAGGACATCCQKRNLPPDSGQGGAGRPQQCRDQHPSEVADLCGNQVFRGPDLNLRERRVVSKASEAIHGQFPFD